MENKSYCISCYNFYIESKEDVSNYRMKHPVTITNLMKKLGCYNYKYKYFCENVHLCKKDLKYNIVDADTYLKSIKTLYIENSIFCENKNKCNQCKDYEKIIYNDAKKVEIDSN